MTIPQLPTNLIPNVPEVDIPDINIPDINVLDATTGQPDFQKIEDELQKNIDKVVNALKFPAIPSLPAIPLIPKLPVITRPTVAELVGLARAQIEKRKKQLQEQRIKTQIADAIREESPFTDRQQLAQRQSVSLRNRLRREG